MMDLDIRLLGAPDARREQDLVSLGGPRQRRLLARLALSPGRVVSFGSVVEAMWPDGDAPSDPRQAVHTAVSRLRSAFGDGDSVVARDGGYVLLVLDAAVDARRFELLVREARSSTDGVRTASALEEALGLWHGDALDGFQHESWARPDATRLEELRSEAIESWAEARLSLGQTSELVATLEAAALRNPLRERTHRVLMQALYRDGRQGEALRCFQRYRQQLATDLGLEPSESIAGLERAIASGTPLTAVLGQGSATPLDDGRELRGYRLHEQIGDGSSAIVYRASQPSVGRDVAIKVIRAELADRPDFIRRFEAEAHLVARLAHPHVVPLYDFWREPGCAYLVMRYLPAGTLRDVVAGEPLGVGAVRRLVVQIGGALATAHRAGIVHRDVKPANIFLDSDGNYYLGDFGIASELNPHTDASPSAGSRPYASPELLDRRPVGPPADVFGFAMTILESLTGVVPIVVQEALSRGDTVDELLDRASACRRPDLTSAVMTVLREALATDPSRRHRTVEDFAAEMVAALDGAPTDKPSGAFQVSRNPYKGLRAFDEADIDDFVGRDRTVQRLTEQLDRTGPEGRAILVVGPSGSGKSSVVRAGLIPTLRQGAVAGSERWFITSMLPGAHPFEELEVALRRISAAPPSELAGPIRNDERGLARAVKRALPADDSELLLVIDQGEELFTLCTDDAERQAFIDGLVAAVEEPRSRLRLVMTMRADFYDRPLRYPALAALFERSTATISPLAPEELDAAITHPAERVGVIFEPGAVARIAADVSDQPGGLPLLQYALTELFERRRSNTLTLDAYIELGGVTGALTQRAEELAVDSGVEALDATRRVFSRLVTPGEGTEDTRRRVRSSELAHDLEANRVVERYGAARLLSFDHDPVTREPTIEVAHEALIRSWPRLRDWLDEDRDGLRLHRHLGAAAHSWRGSGFDNAELYRGGRLESAEHWASKYPDALNPAESDFLSASIVHREAEREAERRSTRRIRRALVAVGMVAAVALLAGVLAIQQRDHARNSADAAETQRIAATKSEAAAVTERNDKTKVAFAAETGRLAALAPNLAETDLSAALLISAEAASREQTPTTWDALERVFLKAGQVIRFLPTEERIRAVFVNGDRVIGVSDTKVHSWSQSTGEEVSVRDLGVALQPYGIGYNPIGFGGHYLVWIGATDLTLAPGDSDLAPFVLDIDGTDPARRIPVDAHSIEIDPLGSTIVVGRVGGDVTAFSSANLAVRWTVAGDGVITRSDRLASLDMAGDGVAEYDSLGIPPFFAFSADGERVDVNRLSVVTTYETATGGELSTQVTLRREQGGIVWAGAPIPTVDPERVIDFHSEKIQQLSTDGTLISSVLIEPLPDDRRIRSVVSIGPATALVVYGAGPSSIVDFRAGKVVGQFDAGVGLVFSANLSPDGRVVAIAGQKGIALLAVDGSGLMNRALPRAASHLFPSGGPDASWVSAEDKPPAGLMPNERTPGRFWQCDPEGTCTESTALGQRSGLITSTQNDRPDIVSTRVLQPGALGNWTFYDSKTLQEIGHFPTLGAGQSGLTFARDFSWVALRSELPHTVRVVSPTDGRVIADLGPELFFIEGSYFYEALKLASPPSGDFILATGLNTGDSWTIDTTTWKVTKNVMPSGAAMLAAFSPSGKYLATVGPSGDLVLRDPTTFTAIRSFAGDDSPSRTYAYQTMAFSDDDRFLVTTYEGAGRLWDVDTGRAIGAPIPSLDASQPAALRGAHPGLLTMSDGWVKIWNLDVTTWRDIACKAAGRNLTHDEWNRFGPQDQPYHATCAQWPTPVETTT